MKKRGENMKTAEEFYREISESKELQEELKAVPEEMPEGELEDDGAEEVVGGGGIYYRSIPLSEKDIKPVL